MSIEGNWRGPVNRRDFIRRMGLGAGALALGAGSLTQARAQTAPVFRADPFTLGVASGDPLPHGVVLWTRLAPEPLEGGGMPPRRVPVRWEVAADDRFRTLVSRGTATADPDYAHSVHVEVEDLAPGREYFYRFKAGAEISPVGRAVTAPPRGRPLERLRFCVVSCQNYQDGFDTAYRHVAEEEDLDLVFHLGDYIYEGGVSATAPRKHEGPEPMDLAAYRNRHARYRSDPDLQAAHAAAPFVATWDDHEVENNYAGAIAQDEPDREEDPALFLVRWAAAHRAYYEHLPLRPGAPPKGPDVRLYRRLRFGDLLEVNVLDARQYRSDQACGDGSRIGCAERLDPARTLTGDAQERWLLDGLGDSRARWNVIAQQVFFAQRDSNAGPDQAFSMDAWDGYKASRDRVIAGIVDRKVRNPVVLTGDVHTHWACDLKTNFDDPSSPTIGTELVGSSISSGGDGADVRPDTPAVLASNPHIRFFNGQRGYVRCLVERARLTADFRIVPFVTRPGAPISTRASFFTEDGRPGLVAA